MSKNQNNWEPDIKKGLDTAKKIKEMKEQIKEASDKRKIDGFNPDDLK
ncbi:MAG: hypothetical protein MUP41_07865 [Desulfobacterales bacterium]|nr:hypothetical protein [Desulfobacterales bacterium]